MQLKLEIEIAAAPKKVWKVLADIDGAVGRISGIEKIEVLERPKKKQDLVGLKWRETRLMWGKEAVETMWITDAVENQFYRTRAESHGAVYVSGFDL